MAATLREAALSEKDVGADAALILLPRPDPEHGAAACPRAAAAMQGSPACEICTAVSHQDAAERHREIQPAGMCSRSVLMSGGKKSSSCHMLPHTHTHAQTHAQVRTPKHFKAVLVPLQSQAATIGLTCITLNTVPIQLDYTSDSAFIRFSFC